MKEKLYDEERDTEGYENTVMKHMLAMTTEGLHSKAAIAVELAYRDHELQKLKAAQGIEPKLDSPAKVNGGIFGKGIPWKTVIEAAQRQYKWHMEEKAKPPKTPEQFAEEQRLLEHFFGKPPVTLTGDIVEQIRALPVGFAGSGTYVRLEDVLEIIEGAKFQAPRLPERFG